MISIEELLTEARGRLVRVAPEDLAAEREAGAIVVDIRPEESRRTEGDMEGAVVIDRNVLEWRLAPSSPDRILDIAAGQRVILVCNEGYASSLAAAILKELGVSDATDLVGGFRAWRALQEAQGA